MMHATQTVSQRQRNVGHVNHDTISVQKRLARLLQAEIDFIMHPSFAIQEREFENEVLTVGLTVSEVQAAPENLPGHLARLCATPILTASEERELFRRMNYLKYRANVLRSRLDPQNPDMAIVKRAENFVATAQQVRDHLVQANMRLAISVVKKFVTPKHSFDDLLSDGIYSLMQAVEKFDFDRGFRFSTYAYRAIARNAYRMINKRQRELALCSGDMEDSLEDALIDRGATDADFDRWMSLRATLDRLLRRLDRRERLIIRCRFALGGHRKTRTFQAIADKLGISKERVRQLEQRAMNKLRDMAIELDLEATIEPALSQAMGMGR